jgi:hypothetical protein
MEVKLESIFGKTAQMMVLKNLIEQDGGQTYLSGIAQETGLSHSSVSRVMRPLAELGIVKEAKFGKQIRAFSLNTENPLARQVVKFIQSVEDRPATGLERGLA